MNPSDHARFAAAGNNTPGFLGRLLAFVLSLALFALAFMFSLAALAVVAVVGLGVAGWFWWKTRALRRHLREQGMAMNTADGGQIIEGEVIRIDDVPPVGKRPHD